MRFPWLFRMVFVTVSPAYALAIAALAVSLARGNDRRLPVRMTVALLSIPAALVRWSPLMFGVERGAVPGAI